MIRSLRRKFILIAIASLAGTLIVLCSISFAFAYTTMLRRVDTGIRLLYEHDGEFRPNPHDTVSIQNGEFQVTQETPFETRYFIVKFDRDNKVSMVDTGHIAALDEEQVIPLIEEILKGDKTKGFKDQYRYGVFVDGADKTVIVMDCFLQLQALYSMFRLILIAVMFCIFSVFLLVLFFSQKATKPFIENLDRQRRFVTDASHELKTPLTIIATNNSILENTLPGNEWIHSTQKQVARMDLLVKNLIELARTEETVVSAEGCDFPISELVDSQTDAFQTLAESKGLRLVAHTEPGLVSHGVQDDIFRLLSLLLDNAIKYCSPNGEVTVRLKRKRRNVVLSISNPCLNIKPEDVPRLFDRFYRADESRSRETGGYGIGLSTAKVIVEQHHGKISAKYEKGKITFTVVLPQCLNT